MPYPSLKKLGEIEAGSPAFRLKKLALYPSLKKLGEIEAHCSSAIAYHRFFVSEFEKAR